MQAAAFLTDGVHGAGGVVVGHILGISALRCADGLVLTGVHFHAVELAVLGVAVEVAVMAVEVAGNEVCGSNTDGLVAQIEGVDSDHIAVSTCCVVVVVSVEGTGDVHDGQLAGSGQRAVSGGDGHLAGANSGNLAVLDGGDGLIAGGPLNILQLHVPGDGAEGQLQALAQTQDSAGGIQPHALNGGGLGDGVLGSIQSQQANQLVVGLIRHNLTGCVVGHIGHGDVGEGVIVLGIDDDQLCAVAHGAAVEVRPVDLTVGEGHGLSVVGSCVGAVGSLDGDLGTGGIVHLSQGILVVLIQGVQFAVGLLDTVEGTLIVHSDHVGTAGDGAVVVQTGHGTGQQVDGVQVDGVSILGQGVHGIGGVVKGQGGDGHTQILDQLAVPQAGLHNHEVVACVHSEDLTAGVCGSSQSVLLHVIAGQSLNPDVTVLSGGLIQGDPAEHLIADDCAVEDTVSIELGGIHLRQVLTSGGVGQLVEALVGSKVAQNDLELSAQVGDVEDHLQIAVLVGLELAESAQVTGAGGVGQGSVSQVHIILGFHNQQRLAVLADPLGGADHLRSGGIDGNGDLQDVITAIAVVHGALDGQHQLGTAGQGVAIGVGELVHAFAVPGIQPGNDGAVVGHVHGLGVVQIDLLVEDFAGLDVGVGKAQGLGVTHQGQIELVNAVQDAVAVGGQGVVGGIINDLAVLAQNSTGVGVHTQDPVGAAQVGPNDGVVLVTVGQTIGSGQAEEAVLIPESGIEHGSIGPVAVEAQEGQAQVDTLFVLGSQVNEAFHVAAVGEVLGKECLVFLRQGDGNGDVGLAAGGNGDGILGELHGTGQSTVLLSHEVQALAVDDHIFGQQAGLQSVGLVFVGDVVDLKAEGVLAVGVVAQLSLGAAAAHSQVSIAFHSGLGIDQTGTLLTGRSLHAGGGVDDGHCGGHEQVLSQLTDGAVGHVGVHVVQILHQQHGNTGNLGGGHGGTVHDTVLAVVNGGVHIAADTGDFRYQTQVGRNAPGREATHLAADTQVHDTLLGSSNQSLDFLLSHEAAVGQGNRNSGNITGDALGQAAGGGIGHIHADEGAVVHIVVDNQSDGAVSFGIGQLLGEVQGTTADDGDLAGHIHALIVFHSAQAGNHNVLQLALTGQGVELDLQAGGLGVGNAGGANGEVGVQTCIVVGGSNGNCIGIQGGSVDGSIVHVGSGVQISAPHIIVGAGAVVTCCNQDNGILRSDTLVDQVDLGIGGGEACGGTQGQVSHIAVQDHGVFQSSHDIVNVCAAGCAEDLHDDDLGIGSHTHDLSAGHIGIGGSDTGNVSTMVAHVVTAVVSHQVSVNVVEGKGNLCGEVQVLCGQTGQGIIGIQFSQNGCDVSNGHGISGQLRICGKGGVIQVKTGIDNGNGHALAGVAQALPHAVNAGHLAAGGSTGSSGALSGGGGMVHRHHEDGLDAFQLCNLFQICKLGADGEGVGQVGELVANLQLLTIQNSALNGADGHVLLLDQGPLHSGGDHGNGLDGVSQGLSLHHDECDHSFVLVKELCGLFQLLKMLRNLGNQQLACLALNGSNLPGAVFGALLFLCANRQRVFQRCGLGHGLQAGAGLGRGCFGFCCFLVPVSIDHTVFASFHCESRGGQSAKNQTQSQKHCQKSFASHCCTSLVKFVAISTICKNPLYIIHSPITSVNTKSLFIIAFHILVHCTKTNTLFMLFSHGHPATPGTVLVAIC